MYILNDAKHIMQDRNNEIFVDDDNNKDKLVEIFDKRKYQQAISECK